LGIEDVLAFICLRRGQLDRAIEQSQSALAIKGQLGGYLFLGLSAAWVAAMTYTARRDYENAHRYLRIMRQQVGQMALNEIVQNNGLFPYGKLCWFEGRFDETRRVYEQMCVLAEQSELSYAQVLRTLLRGMLEISDRQYAQAEQTLSHAIKLEQRELISANFANARLFLAYLYFLWRRPRAALEILSEVLEQCERDATPGVILQEGPIVIPLLELAIGRSTHVEYARQLLVLLDGPDRTRHVPRTPSQGGMTAREIEVVRLIAAGASNRDIAEQLVISLPTVKSHVAHIMDKLDASSRTQIVAKARELKLI
jgi:ATP/maltotriose-dependent transcriptional regulator MalT